MTECPRCKSGNVEVVKSWDVIPKSGRGKPMRVTLYLCGTCGYKYRKATRIEIPQSIQPTQPQPLAEKPELTHSPGEEKKSLVDEVLRLMIVKETSLKTDGDAEIVSKLFEYIKSHDGLLNIKQCSMELELDPVKVKETLDRLLDEGSIVKMEDAESPTKTVEEMVSPPPTPEIHHEQEHEEKLSIFQRIKKAFTG